MILFVKTNHRRYFDVLQCPCRVREAPERANENSDPGQAHVSEENRSWKARKKRLRSWREKVHGKGGRLRGVVAVTQNRQEFNRHKAIFTHSLSTPNWTPHLVRLAGTERDTGGRQHTTHNTPQQQLKTQPLHDSELSTRAGLHVAAPPPRAPTRDFFVSTRGTEMMDVMMNGSMLDTHAGEHPFYGCGDGAYDHHHHLNHHHNVRVDEADDTDGLTEGWSVLDLGDFSAGSTLSVSPAITPASDCDDAGGSPVVRRRRTSSAVSEDFGELLREARGALGMPQPPPAAPLYGGFSAGLFGPSQLTSYEIDQELHGGPQDGDAVATNHHYAVPLAIPEAPSATVTAPPPAPVEQRLLHPQSRHANSRSPASPAYSTSSTASESPMSPYRGSSSWGTHASPSPSPSRSSPGSPMRKRRSNGASTDPALAGQRNHVCQLCDSRFLCRSKLDRHMLTHTGAKPFACFCGKSFNQKSALKNHTRRHMKKGNIPASIDTSRGINGFSMPALVQQKLTY